MKKKRGPVWCITKISNDTWCCELGRERTEYLTAAHCKACALTELVAKYGGDVDLRGLSRYGICYQFLYVTVRAFREPDEEA